jgi:hypothetical protein
METTGSRHVRVGETHGRGRRAGDACSFAWIMDANAMPRRGKDGTYTKLCASNDHVETYYKDGWRPTGHCTAQSSIVVAAAACASMRQATHLMKLSCMDDRVGDPAPMEMDDGRPDLRSTCAPVIQLPLLCMLSACPHQQSDSHLK